VAGPALLRHRAVNGHADRAGPRDVSRQARPGPRRNWRPPLPACQGTATAASHTPPHHAAEQAQNGITITDLHDLIKMKRDLFQRMAQQAQNGITITDLHDLANAKRDLLQR